MVASLLTAISLKATLILVVIAALSTKFYRLSCIFWAISLKFESKRREQEMKTQLQAMRKRAGYKSAKSFADHIGMPVGTYTDYEQGRRMFTLERAREFADALDCSLHELRHTFLTMLGSWWGVSRGAEVDSGVVEPRHGGRLRSQGRGRRRRCRQDAREPIVGAVGFQNLPSVGLSLRARCHAVSCNAIGLPQAPQGRTMCAREMP